MAFSKIKIIGGIDIGCYVNPKNESKEAWLEKHGTVIPISIDAPYNDYCEDECLPVILVDNGLFTAAGVAFDEREFKDFNNPTDPRPKKGYKVKIEDLKTVSDIENYLNGENR